MVEMEKTKQYEDVEEFVQLLVQLAPEERREIKGILIGLKMAREPEKIA